MLTLMCTVCIVNPYVYSLHCYGAHLQYSTITNFPVNFEKFTRFWLNTDEADRPEIPTYPRSGQLSCDGFGHIIVY